MLTEVKTAHVANTYLWKIDKLISIQIIIWKSVYFIKKKTTNRRVREGRVRYRIWTAHAPERAAK